MFVLILLESGQERTNERMNDSFSSVHSFIHHRIGSFIPKTSYFCVRNMEICLQSLQSDIINKRERRLTNIRKIPKPHIGMQPQQ